MKSVDKQIEFIDKKLLPIYGIKNIIDYSKVVYLDDLNKDEYILKKLNEIINEFKQIFPIKNFNLHKTNGEISSCDHSFLFLKKILEISCVYFESGYIKKRKYLRLIPENKILNKYIENMENIKNGDECSYIRNNLMDFSDEKTKLNNYVDKFTQDDLNNNIKKTYTEEFYVYPKYVSENNVLKVHIPDIYINNKNMSNVKLFFVSNKNQDGIEICSEKFINYLNTENRKVSIEVHGSHLTYQFEENYLVKNMFILNKITEENHMNNIKLDNIDPTVIDKILLKIEITYIEFYNNFSNKLKKSVVEQKINLNNTNVTLVYKNGQAYLLAEGRDSNLKNNNENMDAIFEKINGSEEVIGNLRCFSINNINNSKGNPKIQLNINSAMLLLVGESYGQEYDIVYRPCEECVKFDRNFSLNNIHSKKLSYKNTFELSRHGDLIYNIKFITVHPLNEKSLVLNLHKDGEDNNDSMYPLTFVNTVQKDGYYEYEITNINQYNVINMMCQSRIELHSVYSNEKLCNFFEGSKILVSYCDSSIKLRNKFKNCDWIINLKECNSD